MKHHRRRAPSRGPSLAELLLFLGVAGLTVASGFASAQILAPEDAVIVPLAAMTPDLSRKVAFVVSQRTMRRIITTEPFASSVPVYRFLLDNLPLAARIANALQIDSYLIEPRGVGRFYGDDRRGLTGTVMLAYQAPGKRVYYTQGVYDGRFLPKSSGRTVIVLQFSPIERRDGHLIQNRLIAYLRIDNFAIRFMLRPFLPLFKKLVNRKLSRFITAAKKISESLARQPSETLQRINASEELNERDKHCFRRALKRFAAGREADLRGSDAALSAACSSSR